MVQAIIEIINKVLAYFTPKQNVIRLKNELKKLELERKVLLGKNCTAKSIKRVNVINALIEYINDRLRDHATD